MAKTNESHEVKDDIEMEIDFPEIEKDKYRVMLNYMASGPLHSDGLKKYIIAFLIDKEKKKEISDIEAFSNVVIYFRISDKDSVATLRSLNNDFKIHMASFEKEHKGKLFWIFNLIVSYTGDKVDNSAMIGKGDKTYHMHFAKKINR